MVHEGEEDIVSSLLRGLAVVKILSRAEEPLTLAEVARLAETSRATARRLLLTLEHEGYVVVEGALFRLRPRIMELGDAFLGALRVPRLAHPHLVALSDRVRDTCSMTILDGEEVVYVDRVRGNRLMAVSIAVGTRFPASTMSSGRVLLADLDDELVAAYLDRLDPAALGGRSVRSSGDVAAAVARAREDGYAIADQELDPSLRSVAAPVRDPEGRVVAAVNVSTHVNRRTLEQLREEVLPELLATIALIEQDLACDVANHPVGSR